MAFWDWFKRDVKLQAPAPEADIARAMAASVFHKLLVRKRPVEVFDGMYCEQGTSSALTVK